jgi:hypothetical protein
MSKGCKDLGHIIKDPELFNTSLIQKSGRFFIIERISPEIASLYL